MRLVLVARMAAWWFRAMAELEKVAVTGLGFCSALGEHPHHGLHRGESGINHDPELERLPHQTVARVRSLDLRPWLKRRKDRKLMARPAQLALSAAGNAMSGCWLAI
mgnify:CR=1 FL=1